MQVSRSFLLHSKKNLIRLKAHRRLPPEKNQNMKFETEPTQLEIETSKRLWAAAEIMAAEMTGYAVQEIVRSFFRGEDMNGVLAAYLGEDLHGLSLKGAQKINETLAEIRL